jgi:hypothetical protein
VYNRKTEAGHYVYNRKTEAGHNVQQENALAVRTTASARYELDEWSEPDSALREEQPTLGWAALDREPGR